MSSLRLSTFQSFQTSLEHKPVRFRSIKDQALLVYLAMEQHRVHTRSALAGLLWPDETESRARRNLSSSLLNLRKSVGDHAEARALPPFLTVEPQSIAFNPAANYWLDVDEFRTLAMAKGSGASPHPHNCTECDTQGQITQLEQAAELYKGPFLADFSIESDLFETWKEALQTRLAQQALELFSKLGSHHAACGELDQALTVTRRQLQLAPWHEESHRALMGLLARRGQRSAALAQYDVLTQMLMDELGIGPAPETDALYDAIVAGTLADNSIIPRSTIKSDRQHAPVPEPSLHVTVEFDLDAVEANAKRFAQKDDTYRNHNGRIAERTTTNEWSELTTSPTVAMLNAPKVGGEKSRTVLVNGVNSKKARCLSCNQSMDESSHPVHSQDAQIRLVDDKEQQQVGTIGHSPFVVGPPITQPHLFFGRTMELSRIFGWWQQLPMAHVTLIGPRRSGKTSLLRHLQSIGTSSSPPLRPGQKYDWLPQPARFRWVWVDFQDPRMRNLDRLLRHLLRGFGLTSTVRQEEAAPLADAMPSLGSGPRDALISPKPPCTLETFMDAAYAHTWTEPVIVLMDELGTGLAAPELDQSFWWALRALTQATNGLLAFALSANDLPARLAEDHGKTSPFFNIFTTLELGPFTADEAVELMESSPIPFAPDERDWILAQSQGWPILLQILCQERLAALLRQEGMFHHNDEPTLLADPQLADHGHASSGARKSDRHLRKLQGNGWKAAALGRLEPFGYLLDV